MNGFVFFVNVPKTRGFLDGANYVSVWEDTYERAYNKAKSNFSDSASIRLASQEEYKGKRVGYF